MLISRSSRAAVPTEEGGPFFILLFMTGTV
jgi:hypothetical protein